MLLHKGNMWEVFAIADLFLITSNATVKQTGCLVMGRGIAREARDRFKGLDYKLGKMIQELHCVEGRYGLLLPEPWDIPLGSFLSPYEDEDQQNMERKRRKIGCFQTKYRYDQDASIALISFASRKLKQFALKNAEAQIHLNYPGIGNGNLEKSAVLFYLEDLPDNVHIWERSQ